MDRIMNDNPELPYSFVMDILLAKKEVEEGKVSPYVFGYNATCSKDEKIQGCHSERSEESNQVS